LLVELKKANVENERLREHLISSEKEMGEVMEELESQLASYKKKEKEFANMDEEKAMLKEELENKVEEAELAKRELANLNSVLDQFQTGIFNFFFLYLPLWCRTRIRDTIAND